MVNRKNITFSCFQSTLTQLVNSVIGGNIIPCIGRSKVRGVTHKMLSDKQPQMTLGLQTI